MKFNPNFIISKLGLIRIRVDFRGSNRDPVFLDGHIRIRFFFSRRSDPDPQPYLEVERSGIQRYPHKEIICRPVNNILGDKCQAVFARFARLKKERVAVIICGRLNFLS